MAGTYDQIRIVNMYITTTNTMTGMGSTVIWYGEGRYKITDSNRNTMWYLSGQLDKADGPAVEFANGDKCWYRNGKLHRENGPAVEYRDLIGKKWYLEGKEYSEEEYNKKMSDSKWEIKTLDEGTPNERTEYRLNGKLHRETGPAVEYVNGAKFWYLNGEYHREDGLACEYANGIKEWYLHGKRHREDGPAVEYINGTKEWWLNGERHRENGPAIETANGNKEWYVNGWLHREDGPAIEKRNGNKEWYLNGKLHREDGPAIEYANGNKFWYLNGHCHRENGPACEYADGTKFWYLEGKEYSEKEYNKKMNDSKLEIKKFDVGTSRERTEYSLNGKLHRETGPAVEYANGSKQWFLNGKLHREDGPACESFDGSKKWYINGELHREDGPAREYNNGHKDWLLNGKFHRTDGPAIEYIDGTKKWFLEGIQYSEEEYKKKMNNSKLEVRKFDEGTEDERTEYHFNGERHRETGPAVEYANGTKEWWLNGRLHRENGPAIEYADGTKAWYLNGQFYKRFSPQFCSSQLYKTFHPQFCSSEQSNCSAHEIHKCNSEYKPNYKNNIIDAGYRIASTQLINSTKSIFLSYLKHNNTKNKHLKSFSEFLDSEIGSAFLSVSMGFVLPSLPQVQENEHFQKICEEMRIGGMAIGMNSTLESIMTNMFSSHKIQKTILQLEENLKFVDINAEIEVEKVK